jgi:hypothetical protein
MGFFHQSGLTFSISRKCLKYLSTYIYECFVPRFAFPVAGESISGGRAGVEKEDGVVGIIGFFSDNVTSAGALLGCLCRAERYNPNKQNLLSCSLI